MRQKILTPNKISSLVDIARSAGEGVMRIYNEHSNSDGIENDGFVVAYKADESPVTSADLLAHRIIADGLKRITPDIPVVSEEDPDSIGQCTQNGIFWLIDPLDGTREFISRNGEFTVNIALIDNGLAVFGIVFAPCLDLLYWGGKELGAFREEGGVVERMVSVDPNIPTERPLRVVASRSHMNQATAQYIDRLGACELIHAGSSLKFCRVAEGSADIYPRLGPTCEWDTAAAQAIVEAVGGRVCTLDGESLRYGKRDIANPHFIAAMVPPTNLRSL